MTILNAHQIADFEAEVGHKFPTVYKQLLETIGYGSDAKNRYIVYKPTQIAADYEHHFEDAADLFNKYFPIGCNELKQEIWLADMETGMVASIWHETHPDDYPDEEWLTSDIWLHAYFLGVNEQQ